MSYYRITLNQMFIWYFVGKKFMTNIITFCSISERDDVLNALLDAGVNRVRKYTICSTSIIS